ARLRTFLDYRAELARLLQAEWIGVIESIRAQKPDLDFVLTHVDDRFDNRMRDLIGADAGRVLPMLDQYDFTFLVEDPATIWNLGPQRYPEIAKRYQPLTKHSDKLAIDINIVERYQDVYPTKLQTGSELFQLVHLAAQSFPQVALYFENSILAPDLPLLASAASSVTKVEQENKRLVIDSRFGTGVPWDGPATVNGKLWPVRDAKTLWLPAGPQIIEPAAKDAPAHIVDFNGNLKTAKVHGSAVEFSYQSNARASATLDFNPSRIEIDGATATPKLISAGSNFVVQLPRGQHLVLLESR
ncbi:MAG: hypothetical protein JO022_14055, partial [Acidobacteriaceae bacterium]|nr:hypothetical protein [Acidobacteriaceae bacterium]